MRSELDDGNNQSLEDHVSEEAELFYACRKCGDKHQYGEPRSCEVDSE